MRGKKGGWRNGSKETETQRRIKGEEREMRGETPLDRRTPRVETTAACSRRGLMGRIWAVFVDAKPI